MTNPAVKKIEKRRVFDSKMASSYIVVFLILSFFCGVFIYAAWNKTMAEQDAFILLEMNSMSPAHARLARVKKLKSLLDRTSVKAVYLTAYSAGNMKKMSEIVNLINKTELNAVVIDIKDYSGKILYDSNLPLVNELGLKDQRMTMLKELISALHEYDIYVIARQTVFQDPVLALKKSEWALKNTGGGLWRDYKGLAWVDAANENVWKYNLDIAKEALAFGFDEINFDYVRFPSDGNMKAIAYSNNGSKKYEVMEKFFKYLNKNLSQYPVKISIDLFGFVMEKTGEDDMNIGQRLEDSLDEVDVISPMMYPSHYPSGHLGLANPADHPALVIQNGMEKGAPRFENRKAKLRPWIQAFSMGAVYDASKIRAQIDAVDKYTDAGWMMWNASNNYTAAGLKLASENDKTFLESFEETFLGKKVKNGEGF